MAVPTYFFSSEARDLVLLFGFSGMNVGRHAHCGLSESPAVRSEDLTSDWTTILEQEEENTMLD